ncbi:hypothetical protein TNIN_371001 [Trichonephila inaurata madagascariensis]|uniref:Uncharacterized protein n=1 Tax=Trichonephila inaurata madagascariensis TaxID=2747483 RepID=A0A8X6IR05_9ARAC|nr:hypothetical protein TNIN_371001 [Trichonephila inaurata madagascariensis]
MGVSLKKNKKSLWELVCTQHCDLASRVASERLLKESRTAWGDPHGRKATLAVGAARKNGVYKLLRVSRTPSNRVAATRGGRGALEKVFR